MIVIVDYGMGNLRSIQSKLAMIQFESVISNKPADIEKASKLILPGVGFFANGMKNLRESDLIEPLNDAVLKKKTPILGICLGMQLLAAHSEEGDAKGLGWFDAKVRRFKLDNLPVPHVGWNEVRRLKPENVLYKDIPESKPYYFTHSFCWEIGTSDAIGVTTYGAEFVSAVNRDNIYGTQFHPEKSRLHGLKMLENFLRHS